MVGQSLERKGYMHGPTSHHESQYWSCSPVDLFCLVGHTVYIHVLTSVELIFMESYPMHSAKAFVDFTIAVQGHTLHGVYTYLHTVNSDK